MNSNGFGVRSGLKGKYVVVAAWADGLEQLAIDGVLGELFPVAVEEELVDGWGEGQDNAVAGGVVGVYADQIGCAHL